MQASRLFTSAAVSEELNQGQLETNPAEGQTVTAGSSNSAESFKADSFVA